MSRHEQFMQLAMRPSRPPLLSYWQCVPDRFSGGLGCENNDYAARSMMRESRKRTLLKPCSSITRDNVPSLERFQVDPNGKSRLEDTVNKIDPQYDCIVMGGGPAGSTVATLVARAGWKTLLVEREKLPRPSVGESLMPETYWIFERLGVLDQLKASVYPKKVGVQFVNSTGKESAPFFFRSHDDRECSQTWHVDRADFDKMLWDNAEAAGASCHDATRVLDVQLDSKRATGVLLQQAATPTMDVAAHVVVDATGKQAVLGSKLGVRRVDPNLRKAAIWGHFRGGQRDEQGGGVKTVILQTRENRSWFWYIAQADDLISVGVVGDNDYLLKGRGTPAEVFQEELQECERLVQWLAEAQPADELRVDKEFSYSTDRAAGEGWVLVGDAWGFIDPVYSSGVYFALKSAELAADSIIEGLQKSDVSEKTLGRWLPDFAERSNLIRKLVNAFYSGDFRVGQFVAEYPQHREELVDLLIGRIFDGCRGKIFDDLDPWLEAKRRAES
jgi:flavin-dependent dehydrogenase